MDWIFLMILSCVFLPLAIAAAIFFAVGYSRARQELLRKEQLLTQQLSEIERQGKYVENLSRLYTSAIQYDKEKTDFFSNITHELKTPITVILGAIQLIDSMEEPAKNTRHFYSIKQNCYRLLRLINNLLDFARIESGYLKLHLANCNIVYLAEDITQSVIPYAQQKQIQVEFDTECEEIVTAVDMEKVERILLNLLSNAVKFTPSGGKVSVHVDKRENRVLIKVRDTGVGIPAEKQEEIFERFHQVGGRYTRQWEGSGIGLSLVRNFVELHDGNIRVASELGKGTEFTVSFPIRQVEERDEKEEKEKEAMQEIQVNDRHNRIVEAIQIEFSGIYTKAS